MEFDMFSLSSDNAPSVGNYLDPHSQLADDLQDFIRQDIDLATRPEAVRGEPVWQGLREQGGSELWLDTGDIQAIESLWNDQFSGLTTNNSLLNDQVQGGVYDDLIRQADRMLQELPLSHRVREIAFVLNARHGLRLVQRFGCRVSVELHTDFAFDLPATIANGRRLHDICPDKFVVKVPFTPAGIIATAVLRQEEIPVNMTLGFSARQNYLATALANPSFVNVFLGRLNAYVADNQLGDGRLVGEKATLASQREVSIFARGLPESQTRQIAASLRDAEQVERLAGVDVITMPPPVAQQVRQQPPPSWNSRRNEEYQVTGASDVSDETVRLDTLWSVSPEIQKLVEKMILEPPETPEELAQAAMQQEVTDLFPQLSREEFAKLASENKIPRHTHWHEKIMQGELAIDSLLTLAGLVHFARSQQALDERIERNVAEG
jgi:transaldolase